MHIIALLKSLEAYISQEAVLASSYTGEAGIAVHSLAFEYFANHSMSTSIAKPEPCSVAPRDLAEVDRKFMALC